MSKLLVYVSTLVLVVCFVTNTFAQSNPTEGSTALALSPGAPLGSYSLSDFETINPYSGALNFSLPLLPVSGRGQAQYSIVKRIENKWTVDRFYDQFQEQYFYSPETSTWDGLNPGYGIGVLQGRYGGSFNTTNCVRSGGVTEKLYSQSLTRLTFTAADGTEYELRDQLTGGAPQSVPVCATVGFSRGKVFVSADGNSATFISDIDIFDKVRVNEYGPFFATGYLMLADGSRYRISSGVIQWMRDRNGNKLNFTYSGGLTQVTDSLNRTITVGTGLTFKGAGGNTRSVQVSTASLSTVLRAGYAVQTYAQLFPELNGSTSTQFNPTRVSAITLPNNKQYKFFYNNYGELARIELPTGGAIEYDWAAGLTNSNTSGTVYLGPVLGGGENWQIYRRVVERRVYPDGGTGSSFASKMTFSRPETIDGSLNIQTAGHVLVDQYNSAGTLLTREKHYYFGSAGSSLKVHSGISYTPWKEGKEYKTEAFHSNGATILRRLEHTWQQPISGSNWPLTTAETNDGVKANNPQITDSITTLEPGGANQVAKQSFTYDKYSNRTDHYEYNFGTGTPGPLVRRTSTTYVTTNVAGGTTYDYACDPATNCSASATLANVIHIRNLVKQISIYDASGLERGRTTTEYDNYAADTNHAGLINRSAISGLDTAFTTGFVTRGNTTGTSRHLISTAGAVTGSVSSYQQYDIAGNVVKTIDARGNPTTFTFNDCFGAPDGNARLNSAPLELSSAGQESFAFVTSVTNAQNHTTFSQFDFYLPTAIDDEDANGIVTSRYFNDSLDRPTQVRRAVGTAAQSQTTIAYDDDSRIVTTTHDKTANNDNLMVSKMVYDGMGRTVESRQYEGGTNYIAVQQQYDALGRPWKVSNPFRPYLSETAVWSTTLYDALDRVTSVATPDSATVTMSYSGNTATMTDQAGKSRKSVTDALGRLVDVYEDPNGLNYQTSYLSDVLDNLVRVTQGTQQRFFMYDSLKRLIRARNPEQVTLASLNLADPVTGNSAWSFAYQYDANSNLTQKTDARGVVSTYAYDVLNRNTTIDYSDTASINPDVKWFYDGATNGKGRFWHSYKGGDASAGANVDHTAIDSYDAIGRPLVQRQLFKLNGTWSPTYQISRSYNLAGAITSQTYPSGHTVSYSYDAAGRTASFSGNLGDGVSRTYASSFVYNSRSQITQELFGTQTPLYHKLQYNIRGQLWDVRVATGADVNGSWNRGALQFFYESTLTHGASGPDNNGNVLKSSHYAPLDETSSTSSSPYQLYTYDALNRLTSVKEYALGTSQPLTQTALQTYTYDRWGNRKIDVPNTWGTGINNKSFDVNTTNNRLAVPAGQTGVMTYDNAGNLTADTYTGAGSRTYDAENKMLTAIDNTGQTSRYTYNADGNRVRRQVASGQEEWQIYGMQGELVAEYRASSSATTPEKEYGYRDGQLLITATGRFNVALAENGAVATASSTATGSGFSTNGAINGNYRGPWGNGVEGWNDNTPNVVPDWIQVDFAGSKTIDEISVFSLHDNYTVENTPTETQTFTLYGLIAFNVQYWNGSSWVTVTGGNVTGNNKVWRKFTFSPVTTSKIRVTINTVPDSWSRVVEIQAFGTSAGGEKVQWLVPDNLGTPRIVLDQTGSLANVRRHDYLPFGEELVAGTAGRTVIQGYAADGVRQQFTGKERDTETGLNYFINRYYSPVQGRFSSVDPSNAEAASDLTNPQGWNGYSYVKNNPCTYTDPDGRCICILQRLKNIAYGFRSDAEVQALEDKWRNWLREKQKHYGILIWVPEPSNPPVIVNPDSLSRDEVFKYAALLKRAEEEGNIEEYSPEQVRQIREAQGLGSPPPVPVLVTNISFPAKQLQKKFKHAGDFGVTGNYNAANQAKFQQAIEQHVRDPLTKVINGTYQGKPVTHYLNPSNGLNVMKDASGNFISGWKLNPTQQANVLFRGSL
jgi:RHS repeat-associated protein